MYVIWSIGKAGWVSRQGNYTSQLAEAKQFSHLAALDACAKHPNHKSLDWFAVPLTDLLAIQGMIK
jgi:hypothetical protein